MVIDVELILEAIKNEKGEITGFKEVYIEKESTAENEQRKITEAIQFTQERVRAYRAGVFKAMDILKSNVLFGLDKLTDDERTELVKWYQQMLDLPTTITSDNYMNLYEIIPEVPIKVQKYIQ